MSRKSSESSAELVVRSPASPCNGSGFVTRLGDIPLVHATIEKITCMYNTTREKNLLNKYSLAAAELSFLIAVRTTRFVYNVVPTSGMIGKIKHEVERKVFQVDSLACHGLDVLQAKFPAIMGNTNEISGIEELEKSEFLEAALIVGETVVNYLQPDDTGKIKEENANTEKPLEVSIKKLDRVKKVSIKAGAVLSNTVIQGGYKVFWGMAVVPWYVTRTGLDVTQKMASGTLDVMASIPGLSKLFTTRERVRRGTRRRTKTKPEYVTSPFPVSPDKKRKRSHGGSSDEESLQEILHVNESYVSEEDPDYKPSESENEGDQQSDESSETVGANGEDEDSGEGEDEEDSESKVEAGGQTLTADEVSRKDGKIISSTEGSSIVIQMHDGKATVGQDRSEGEQKQGAEDAAKREKKQAEITKSKSPLKGGAKEMDETKGKGVQALTADDVSRKPDGKIVSGTKGSSIVVQLHDVKGTAGKDGSEQKQLANDAAKREKEQAENTKSKSPQKSGANELNKKEDMAQDKKDGKDSSVGAEDGEVNKAAVRNSTEIVSSKQGSTKGKVDGGLLKGKIVL